MDIIEDMAALEALFDPAVPASLTKVTTRMTPLYRQWIDGSRFAVLSTVGAEGTDASPRGDDGPVVRIVDDQTVWMPDWRGNNRIDSLRNIVRDARVSLMFTGQSTEGILSRNLRTKHEQEVLSRQLQHQIRQNLPLIGTSGPFSRLPCLCSWCRGAKTSCVSMALPS